jgi:hypothetical protein
VTLKSVNASDGSANSFAPRRSMSIHRSFYKHNTIPERENDIWVERIVLGGNKGPQTYFKSLYSNECRKEPPTGSTTIIYLEDMIERKTPSTEERQKIVQLKSQKKASFFGFFTKNLKRGKNVNCE